MTASAASLRSSERAVARALVTLEHMNSENTQEWDRTIKTFSHARYELPDGRIVDGGDDVMDYWIEGRTAIPDQRNELISLEVCDGGQVLLYFWLRGTPVATGKPFETKLWAVFDFDDNNLMTNERVYRKRPSAAVIAGDAASETVSP
ncbi:MAG: nuclear transport factor 2 family protein [Acidimicrobiales bacterium]